MKFKLSYIIFYILLHNSSNGQNVDFCGQQHIVSQWFKKNKSSNEQFNQHVDKIRKMSKNVDHYSNEFNRSPIKYTIPVVFHILHLGGTENISEAQILDQMKILNRDYQKFNSDTSFIIPEYKSNIADIGFEFKLAQIDPDGKCTNGIIRHYTDKTNWDANRLEDFIYTWPAESYLNFYIVKSINIAPAYSFLPGLGIPPSADVVVCQSNLVGSIGSANVANSRVLTHEVGHWFGLPHIWGITNAPGVACGDDFVDDTPITKGFTVCNPTNSKICEPTITENWQNYMDYTPCKLMFTNGQKEYMYNTILSGINQRDNLVSEENLTKTGIKGSQNCLPFVNFNSSKTVICKGESAKFNNKSIVGNSSFSLEWKISGGLPNVSSDSSVDVQFLEVGNYEVKLIVTSPNGKDSLTQLIKVVDGSNGIKPSVLYSFDDGNLPSGFIISNPNMDSAKWIVNNTIGANNTTGAICIKNFGQTNVGGNYDYFDTPFFDFSSVDNPSFSYYYAYAKKNENQLDSFRIQYSTDCGQTWKNLSYVPQTQSMATNSGGVVNDDYIPNEGNWKKATIPAFSNVAAQKKSFVLRFLFKADSKQQEANNLYIDEINITNGTTQTNNILDNLGFKIYPNPSINGEVFIELNTASFYPERISIYKIDGTRIQDLEYKIENSDLARIALKNIESLKSGIYFIKIHFDNGEIRNEKFIILN